MKNPIFSAFLALFCSIPLCKCLMHFTGTDGMLLIIFLAMLTGMFIGMTINAFYMEYEQAKKAKIVKKVLDGLTQTLEESAKRGNED